MIKRIVSDIISDSGWRCGTDIEDRVAYWLMRAGHLPISQGGLIAQQHHVGRYRLDFAWPCIAVALEVDGWHHRRPETAGKDAVRDSELRHLGWVVLRVDDEHGPDSLEEQVARASQIVLTLVAHHKVLR